MSEPFPTDEALRWTERWRREHADAMAVAADLTKLCLVETIRGFVQPCIDDGWSYEEFAAIVAEAIND